MNQILEVTDLTKSFITGDKTLTVLDNISFSIQEGDSISVVGPSGCGKTTLLGLCAGLDTPTAGTVTLDGIKLNALSEDDKAYVRNKNVGFIFQNFQLLPTITAIDNVMVPLELRGEKGLHKQAKELLGRVGLGDRTDHYPAQLSGGEQQRVAIARAFFSTPKIMFADEPTGNLDEETANTIANLLFEINREAGTTLILVTHNMELAENTDRILQLKGGQLIADKQLKAV